MSALTATWSCPNCGKQMRLPVNVASTETIRDEHGRATGILLTPEVDTSAALAHLAGAPDGRRTMSPRRPYAPPCTGCAGTGRRLVVSEPYAGQRRVEWATCTGCDGSGRTWAPTT